MKGAARVYWRLTVGKRAKERLVYGLQRLAFYCQPAELAAKDSTDLLEAIKQFTYWPEEELLDQIESAVLTLAFTERKNPSRKMWKAFELVDRRMPKLGLVNHIDGLVSRAKGRFEDTKDDQTQEKSQPLVFWLLRIGYRGADGLKALNPFAAFKATHAKETVIRRKREATLQKFQRSGKVVKRTREDAESLRLMELMRKSGTNGLRAFEELCKRHKERVTTFVEQILGSNSAADDTVQKVFICVWKAAAEYVPTAKFTTWLLEIAKNTAINEKKRAEKEKDRIKFAQVSETESSGDVSELTEGIGDEADNGSALETPITDRGARLNQLHEALDQLEPLERRILIAIHGFAGARKTCQEIARSEEMTPAEVTDVAEDAMRRIRQMMG